MQPTIFAVGKLIKKPRLISAEGRKPFLEFGIECKNPFREWPDRVKCKTWNEKLISELTHATVGSLISVQGNAQAEAYMSQKTSKPVAIVVCVFNSAEIFVVSATPAPASAPVPAPASAPVPDPSTGEDNEDDVPF